MNIKIKKCWVYGVALAASALVITAGNWHVMHGSDAPLRLVRKISWSLSELVINTDQLGNMPMIFARSQYPLFLAVVERNSKARQELHEATQNARFSNLNTDLPTSNAQAMDNIKSVSKGFSRATVIQLLGEPDSRTGPFQSQAGTLAIETLYYNSAGNVVITGSEVSTINITAKNK